jgi:hypothetical protein
MELFRGFLSRKTNSSRLYQGAVIVKPLCNKEIHND